MTKVRWIADLCSALSAASRMRIRGAMSKSRRQFLTNSSLGLLGIAVTSCNHETKARASCLPERLPLSRRRPPVGPEVSPATFAEAEKLVQVELSEGERKEAAASWRSGMAPLYERRAGPRKVALEPALAPWSHCEAALPGQQAGPDAQPVSAQQDRPRSAAQQRRGHRLRPRNPAVALDREARKLSSERLTNIYLQRMERFNPTLHCVITPTRELAMAQAKQADQEIAAGHYRGPLHGIPWGGKGSARHRRHSDHLRR